MARHDGKPGGTGMAIGAPRGAPMVPTNPAAEALAAMGGARGMVKTDTGIRTAVHVEVPRVLARVTEEILYEAAQLGEDFIYAWEVNDRTSKTGKSMVEGISIDGAMILYRNWGNCALPTDLVDETPTHFVIKATFVDFEKGVEVPRLFRQRKSERRGGMDAERAEDIAFQIAQSKCQRNAIEKAIPRWLQDRAIEAAKTAAERRYQDVPKAVADARAYAKRLGITDDELQRKVGQTFENWLPRDLVILRTVFRAISDKQTTIDLEFRQPAPGATTAAAEPEPTPTPTEPEPEPSGFDGPEITPEPDRAPTYGPAAAAAAGIVPPPPAAEPAPPPTPAETPEPDRAAPKPEQAPPPPEVKDEPEPKPKPEPKPDFTPPPPKRGSK